MKNVLVEKKTTKLQNKHHSVENKTAFVACLKNVATFLIA
jgi:hypothetical protein